MANALNVANVVNVTINLAPKAASGKNFGILAIFGDSDVISTGERFRRYSGISEIASDFGSLAPEYNAAAAYFGQMPTPTEVIIARWARVATPAVLRGAVLTTTEQAISAWNTIEDGSFKYVVNGTEYTASAIDLSSVSNLNGVASAINSAIGSHSASCTFDGERFIIQTTGTGSDKTLGYFTSAGTGTDLSAKLKLTTSTAAGYSDGGDSETPVEAIAALDDVMDDFYFCSFASSVALTDDQHMEVAAYVEASEYPHLYGITATNPNTLETTTTTDIASRAKEAALNRTIVQYSSANSYAVNSIFGRMATVNFSGQSTAITLKFKQEPGVTYETLSQSQATALKNKNCNMFVYYNNDTSIIQEGVVASGEFIDTIHNLDALANALQTALYNALYTAPTKIPQSDKGYQLLATVAKSTLNQFVANGVIRNNATWKLADVGDLHYGDLMSNGYYVYVPAAADQSQSDRENRKLDMSICVALAGAVHFVNATINVQK